MPPSYLLTITFLLPCKLTENRRYIPCSSQTAGRSPSLFLGLTHPTWVALEATARPPASPSCVPPPRGLQSPQTLTHSSWPLAQACGGQTRPCPASSAPPARCSSAWFPERHPRATVTLPEGPPPPLVLRPLGPSSPELSVPLPTQSGVCFLVSLPPKGHQHPKGTDTPPRHPSLTTPASYLEEGSFCRAKGTPISHPFSPPAPGWSVPVALLSRTFAIPLSAEDTLISAESRKTANPNHFYSWPSHPQPALLSQKPCPGLCSHCPVQPHGFFLLRGPSQPTCPWRLEASS